MNFDVDKIKRLVAIGDLLGSHDKRVKCPLPAHDDKKPSCDVDHDAGLWHCWACDEGGDIFSLLMKRDGLSFVEALQHLADKAGVELTQKTEEAQAEWDRQERISKALAYATEYYHKLLFEPGGISWLSSRQITEATARHFKIGIADGKLLTHIQQTEIPGLSFQDFIDAGLIVEKEGKHRDYFRNRITFPLFARGKVVNISGRVLLSDEIPKYLHLQNRPTEHFYNEAAIGKKIWLFEGHPDTVTGHQCGLPSVGVIGTNGMTHPERLKRCEEIFICADSDKAGQKAADTWAAEILRHNPLCTVRFVVFPDKSKDMNEWYQRNHGKITDAFEVLQSNALPIIEYKISKLQNVEDLVQVWALLENMPAIQRERYYKLIKQQMPAISIKLIRESFNNWIKARATNISSSLEVTGENYESGTRKLPSNIGFTDLKSHICVFAEIERRSENGQETKNFEPVILQVTIDPETQNYQTQSIYAEQQQDFNPHSIPSHVIVGGRWSADSINAFRQGAPLQNTASLLQDLCQYFKKYIWHEDPITYKVLALYTMGTYVARVFHAYPYLSLNGMPGSGKTNTLELLEQTCFNAIMAANVSLSGAFRTIEKCFCTYIRDEAETFNKKTPENQDELLILNAGYKASGIVIRVEKGKNGEMEPAYFNVYSPKIFAGVNMLNEILMTRSILISMMKAPRDKVSEIVSMSHHPEQWMSQAASLRDRLYQWALTKFHLVREAYKGFPAQEKVIHRDWEVWSPLLAIALLADNEVEPGQPVEYHTQQILRFAEAKCSERKQLERENAVEPKVLQTILQLIKDKKVVEHWGHTDYYIASTLAKAVDEVLQEEGFLSKKEMTPRWLGKILRSTGIIPKQQEVIKDFDNKTKVAFCVKREILEKVLEEL